MCSNRVSGSKCREGPSSSLAEPLRLSTMYLTDGESTHARKTFHARTSSKPHPTCNEHGFGAILSTRSSNSQSAGDASAKSLDALLKHTLPCIVPLPLAPTRQKPAFETFLPLRLGQVWQFRFKQDIFGLCQDDDLYPVVTGDSRQIAEGGETGLPGRIAPAEATSDGAPPRIELWIGGDRAQTL